MLYIPYDALTDTLKKGLLRAGLDEKRAAQLADVFAGNSAEGVYSHGVNRYMRFLGEVENGIVDLKAETEVVSSFGALEVRDAHFGIGPINAEDAMARAVALSKEHGIACVAVRNTNHWLRPGRYGWQAANAGVIGMCWSNTIYGGYDENGNLTTDPEAIQKSKRPLPIGYWKGSALSLALDMIASATALGRTTAMVAADSHTEYGITQIFIAINFRAAVDPEKADEILDTAVDYLLGSTPVDPEKPVRYPGQNTAQIRETNLSRGVPIHEETWEKILAYVNEK